MRVLSVYPGRTATEQQARIHELEGREYAPESLMQPEDVARAIMLAVTLPARTVIEEMVISPTHLRDVNPDLAVAREFGRPAERP